MTLFTSETINYALFVFKRSGSLPFSLAQRDDRGWKLSDPFCADT